MDTIQILGSAMGLGLLAGIRLYATVFFAGLAIRFGWFDLNPALQHLSVLGEYPVLFVSGTAMVIEFLADKIPWVDSLWDSVHTIVRPIGAAALGFAALGQLSPVMQVLAGLLAGGVAFTGHSSKAAARLAVNHSPEPMSNWALSFAEDLAIPAGLWIVFEHPGIAIALACVFIAVFLWLSPKVFRLLNLSWTALKWRFRRWFGAAHPIVGPAVPPDALLTESARRALAELPFQPIPDKYSGKLRASFNADGIRAGIHCAATRSIKGLKNSTGFLCVLPDQLVFVTRRSFRMRTYSVAMADLESLAIENGIFMDRLYLKTAEQQLQFDLFKAPRASPRDDGAYRAGGAPSTMTDANTFDALSKLLNELLDGSAADATWVLNPTDPGLLKSIDTLSAEKASAVPAGGGASIAAHVDHLRYGLELLNRWSNGEEPFGDADYSASWKRNTVSEAEWQSRRDALRLQAQRWRESLQRPRHLSTFDLAGVIGSVAHLAYHFGAIRQIDRSIRGPSARD